MCAGHPYPHTYAATHPQRSEAYSNRAMCRNRTVDRPATGRAGNRRFRAKDDRPSRYVTGYRTASHRRAIARRSTDWGSVDIRSVPKHDRDDYQVGVADLD